MDMTAVRVSIVTLPVILPANKRKIKGKGLRPRDPEVEIAVFNPGDLHRVNASN